MYLREWKRREQESSQWGGGRKRLPRKGVARRDETRRDDELEACYCGDIIGGK